jgi:DNA polymerase-1
VIAEKVLTWRQLSKLKSTYTDALPREIHPQTGRVHTSFSMAATTTGRLSSSEPNLQNIPIRTEEGRRIREAFVADAGHKLISADYSQIELRLLAHIADMDVLKQAFKDGRDIHATTASQMFGVPLDAVDSELRRKAKTINFGIIYGISAHGLAQRLGIGRPEAAEYINAYFEQYPGIKAYMERTKEEARANGYVTTLFGRRVYVKDIAAKNPNLRAFSERAAINAPLQGTAADIIKRAMVSVYDALAAQFPEARLLLQVHDELIVEAPEAQAEAVAALIKTQMSAAAHLSVPLLVEAGIGDHWGEIH